MKANYLILAICMCFLSVELFGQEAARSANTVVSTPELFDSFSNLSGDDASSRIDGLINAVEKNPNNKGILFVFCGRSCQYGEVEAHLRGIKMKLNFRKLDASRYLVLHGGYREKVETELWLVPENACTPIPNSTVEIQNVKFNGTFKKKFVPYDCCE